MFLIKLKDVLLALLYFVSREKVKDAAEEAINSKDQRELENAIGGSAPTSNYDGMLESEQKDS